MLAPEVARIKVAAPQQYKPQVDDMEKRINILFDHLNNNDLLSDSTVQEMVEISRCVQARDWERATAFYNEMQTGKLETEGTNWMVRVPQTSIVIKIDADMRYRLVLNGS